MGVKQFLCVTALLLVAGASTGFAQTVNRLAGGIATSSVVELKGSAHPLAMAKNDAGRMSSQARLEGMTLHFALTDAQKTELDALLVAQQTVGSSNYHQWLTPTQFASRFGLSETDLEQVKSWLEQQGFTVNRVGNSRMSINFSGTVRQVESAFGAEMHYYTVGGTRHFANAAELKLPAALNGVVSSLSNISDFRPQPHRKASPNFTSATTGSHFMTPLDAATIYDVNAAYNNGYTGSGQTIVVVGQSAVDTADVQKFQSALGWTSYKLPTTVLVPNTGTSTIVTGDEGESDLDLEYTSTIAKGATIYFVYTGNSSNNNGVFDSIEYAVDNRLGSVISVSYGSCEAVWSQSDFNSYEAIMAQGAAQGQSIIASSGDNGSNGCYYLYENYGSTYSSYAGKISTSYPASSAYVTAVGGTEFSSANSTSSTYWSSASSSDVISSAKSYIPEVVWNDSSSSGLSAGGGGTSVFATRPSWQTGVTGISTATDYSKDYRMLPDVSLASSPSYTGYVYCSSDSTSTGITGSCSNGFRDTNSKYLTVAGGTSFAAPIFAGMVAILNQKLNSTGQGLINATLYSLASNATTYASAFHDITSGNNACTGVSTCNSTYSTYYTATTGYDEATGLGSVDFNNLLNAWPTSSTSASLTSSTTTLSAATTSPSSGASDAITITVASGSSSVTSTPTGTLAIYVDGTEKVSALALTSGVATYSFSSTTTGTHTITATYSGDATYAASTGSVVVTIASSSTSSSSGTFTVALNPSSMTISSSGGSSTSTVTVTPANSYTGTVNFSLSTSNTTLQNNACYSLSSAKVTGTSAVTSTLTLYYGSSYCKNTTSVSGSGVHAFKLASSSSASRGGSDASVRMAALGGFGVLFAGLIGWRFRRVRGCMSLLALVALGMALSGCGSSTSSTSPGTTTSTSYTLTVEGVDSASSSIYSTATLTLTVD
jgi:hypothetical protein